MWMVDTNGYYTDRRRKYISYDNPYIDSNSNGMNMERDALVNALAIGYLLNRTVILPKFHCHTKRGTNCQSNEQHCSLMTHYHVERFDAYFANSYREHVFLSHDLVPRDVRQSQSSLYSIESEQSTSVLAKRTARQHVRTTKLVPANKKQGATSAEVLGWFAARQEQILQFSHLYWSFAGFDNTVVESTDIRHRLRHALIPANYRQYRQYV